MASQRTSSQIPADVYPPNSAGREFQEDASSFNLRPLVSLTPQPRLPQKLSNILSHWRLGDDPASYDWEAAQRATALVDSEGPVTERPGHQSLSRSAKKRVRNKTDFDVAGKMAVRTDAETPSQQEGEDMLETRRQVPAVVSSQIPESSQIGVGVSSQPLAGRFAGGKKVKKGKKRGF